MNSPRSADMRTLDRLDEQIVRCLQLSPRAPFRLIGDVLGVAEQTVNRRYRTLVRSGILRIVTAVDPTSLGESDWMVRVRTRPDTMLDVGRALARRPDVSWVGVCGGGAELVCAVRSQTQQEREHLLLDRLPRNSSVLDVSTSVVMRRFVGGSASDWVGVSRVLTPEQVAGIGTLERTHCPLPAGRGGVVFDGMDRAMLDVLLKDGRAGVSTLARAAGVSEGRAARRLAALIDSGTLYIDLDLAEVALGFAVSAYIWLTVAPAHLDAACRALAQHEEAPFVAAITGRQNVIASLTLRDLDALYVYVTERIGAIEGITNVEVSPVLRRLKKAGTLMDGEQQADPGAG